MFKFRLEAVLRQRQQQLEEAQLALAEAMRREIELRRLLGRLREEKEESRRELRRAEAEGLSADEFLLRRWHLDGLRLKIAQTAKKLEESVAEVHRRRSRLMEAAKRKKMVETLKHKAFSAYQAQERRQERIMLDEFAVLGFARARGKN